MKLCCTYCKVRADFPTPPSPRTTRRYLLRGSEEDPSLAEEVEDVVLMWLEVKAEAEAEAAAPPTEDEAVEVIMRMMRAFRGHCRVQTHTRVSVHALVTELRLTFSLQTTQ